MPIKDLSQFNTGEKEILERILHLRNIKGLPRLAVSILREYLSQAPPAYRTGRLYLIMANLYIDVGETKKAFAAFRLAERKARKSNDQLLLADVLRKYGYLYLHTEPRSAKAAEKINEAITVVNKLIKNNPTEEVFKVAANCYASLGNYLHHRDRPAAKEAYQRSLAYCQQSKFREREVTVLSDLGRVAMEEKNWSEAKNLLEQAITKARAYYQHALPSSLLRLGLWYMDEENTDKEFLEAEKYFRKSLGTAKKSGWKREEAEALAVLGKLKYFQKNFAEAKVLKKKSETIYKKIGYKSH